MDIDYNDPLADRIIDVLHSGQSARLSDLTTFAWDEVHLFNEGASREQIEQVVGSPIIRDKFYWSSASLLVFEDNGQVVKTIGVTGDFLRADHSTWPSDVLLEPWGNGALRLTLPPEQPLRGNGP